MLVHRIEFGDWTKELWTIDVWTRNKAGAIGIIVCLMENFNGARLSFWTVVPAVPKPSTLPAIAAPSAVVSAMAGLRTGMPRRSDWICMRRPFCDMPPSARRLLLRRPSPLSDSIASKISLTKHENPHTRSFLYDSCATFPGPLNPKDFVTSESSLIIRY